MMAVRAETCYLIGDSKEEASLGGFHFSLCIFVPDDGLRAETCYLIGDSKEETSLGGFHFSLCIFVPDDGHTGRNMFPDYVKTRGYFTIQQLYLFISIDPRG